jgi:prepilin-type N-terminal cleavage/methylation domain-containing protein
LRHDFLKNPHGTAPAFLIVMPTGIWVPPPPLKDHPSAVRRLWRGGGDDIVHMPVFFNRSGRSGFTMLELMVVLTIMGIIMVLALPAVKGFSGSAGRKGAINMMLNTFEQARVAALTSGTNVYVGFANDDKSFPKEMQCRAFIVFRDRLDSDKAYAGSVPTYTPLTKWVLLPKGISFRKDPISDSSLLSDDLKAAILPNNLPQPKVGQDVPSIPVLTFNASGFIETDGKYLRILIYQGFQGDSGPNFTSQDDTYFDMVGLRKYTGRAELFLASKGP